MQILQTIADHLGLIAGVALLLLAAAFWKTILWIFGVLIIPDDSIGAVTKKFVLFGANRTLPDGQIIALNGEAGYQADTLPPGIQYGLWPWQYTVERVPFFTIPPAKIGVVQACDGKPLPGGRIIATDVDCDYFQDARRFLISGGERGPQMKVIPPGTYRINPLLFTVTLHDAINVPPGRLGVVEARDGR